MVKVELDTSMMACEDAGDLYKYFEQDKECTVSTIKTGLLKLDGEDKQIYTYVAQVPLDKKYRLDMVNKTKYRVILVPRMVKVDISALKDSGKGEILRFISICTGVRIVHESKSSLLVEHKNPDEFVKYLQKKKTFEVVVKSKGPETVAAVVVIKEHSVNNLIFEVKALDT